MKKNSKLLKARAVADKKNRIKNLADSYIRESLHHGRGFNHEQITPELITAQRALIKLKRAIRETV